MIDRQLNYGRHLIEKFAKSAPYSRVLDLGAGHGDDLILAKKVNPQAELFAIENFGPYAQKLKTIGVKVFEVNLERDQLPFEDESIDLIICNQILEHCKEVWWIFNEMSRVLRKGGKLIIGVPNLASLHNRILLLVGKQPTSIKNNTAHLRGYTKGDIVKLLNSGFPNGYVLVNSGGSNFYPFPGSLAKPLARAFPGAAVALFLMFEKKEEYKGGFLQYPIDERLETNFYLGS